MPGRPETQPGKDITTRHQRGIMFHEYLAEFQGARYRRPASPRDPIPPARDTCAALPAPPGTTYRGVDAVPRRKLPDTDTPVKIPHVRTVTRTPSCRSPSAIRPRPCRATVPNGMAPVAEALPSENGCPYTAPSCDDPLEAERASRCSVFRACLPRPCPDRRQVAPPTASSKRACSRSARSRRNIARSPRRQKHRRAVVLPLSPRARARDADRQQPRFACRSRIVLGREARFAGHSGAARGANFSAARRWAHATRPPSARSERRGLQDRTSDRVSSAMSDHRDPVPADEALTQRVAGLAHLQMTLVSAPRHKFGLRTQRGQPANGHRPGGKHEARTASGCNACRVAGNCGSGSSLVSRRQYDQDRLCRPVLCSVRRDRHNFLKVFNFILEMINAEGGPLG